MASQPGFVDDMRPGGRRPPPAREVALAPVRGWLTERLHLAEVEQRGVLQSDGVTAVASIGIDELDAVGQLAGLHGHVGIALFIE